MSRLTMLALTLLLGCSDAADPALSSDASLLDSAELDQGDGRSDGPYEGSTADVGVADTRPVDAAPIDGAADVGQPTLVVSVQVPASTPSGDGIFMTGNQPELGDWDGRGTALTHAGGGRWTTSLSFAIGTTLEYKFTRGDWETVEKDAGGGEIANRTHTISASVETLDGAVASWRDQAPIVAGPPGLDFIRGVSSQFLGPDRDIVVYLPPGYGESPAARYPVLYMHDGQNLMDPATSAFGVAWEIDDAATTLIEAARIEPLIIVGIYNTGDRIAEYTPVPDPEYGGGDADAYGRFIVEELKPDIDATYRTRPDAASTGLAGSSLGGLVSMYLGIERSDVFARLGVVSPSVWWADMDIVARVQALEAKLPLRIWLDIGTAEGGGRAVGDTRVLRDALVAEGWVLGEDLRYGEYPGAAHNEAAWAARADDILEALFPR